MPSPRKKEIIINSKINSVLKEHFKDNIQTLTVKEIEKLYNSGSISSSVYKFLKDVVKYQGKGNIEIKYTYDIKEKPKIKVTLKLNEILTDNFDGEIKNIRASSLKQLLKDKKITKEEEKELIKLKKAQVKGILDDVVEYENPEPPKPESPRGPPSFWNPELEPQSPVYDDNSIDNSPTYAPGSPPPLDEGSPTYAPGSPPVDERPTGLKPEPLWEDMDEINPENFKGTEWAEKAITEAKKKSSSGVNDVDNSDDGSNDEQDEIDINIKEGKYLTVHRKAFVDFVNNEFYKDILRQTKDSKLNVYQVLVREYL